MIFRSGEPSTCMYFIAAGTVAIYSPSGREVCHLYDGDYFGEIGLLGGETYRTMCVIAVECCNLYRLDREDYEETVAPFPDLVATLQKTASDRLNKIKLMDARIGKFRTSTIGCKQSVSYERIL